MAFLTDLLFNVLGKNAGNEQADHAIADYRTAESGSVNAFAPYLSGGTSAFGRAVDMTRPGYQFSPADPSYAWRRDENINALDRRAAAQGSRLSGGQLRGLSRYIQDYASTEYGNAFNRNAGLGQVGFNAAGATSEAMFRGAEDRASAYGYKGANDQAFWGNTKSSWNNAGDQIMSAFGGG